MNILKWLTGQYNKNQVADESNNKAIKLKQQFDLNLGEIVYFDYSKLGFKMKGEVYHYIGSNKALYGNKYIYDDNNWRVIHSYDAIHVNLY